MKKLIFVLLICNAFDKNELIATLPKNFLAKFAAQKSIQEKTKYPERVKKRRMELNSETEKENKQKIKTKEKKAKYTTDMTLNQLLFKNDSNFLKENLEDPELFDFLEKNLSHYINQVTPILPKLIITRQIKLLRILLDPININQIFYIGEKYGHSAKYGHTALSYAIRLADARVELKDLDMIKLILEKGANVNQLVRIKVNEENYDCHIVLNALFNLEMRIRNNYSKSNIFNKYLIMTKEIAKLIFYTGANIAYGKIFNTGKHYLELVDISTVINNGRNLRTIRCAYKEFYKNKLMETIQKGSSELAAFPPGVLPIVVDYILNGFSEETLLKSINTLGLSAEINHYLMRTGKKRIIDLVNLSEGQLLHILCRSVRRKHKVEDALELLGLQIEMNIKEDSLKKNRKVT